MYEETKPEGEEEEQVWETASDDSDPECVMCV